MNYVDRAIVGFVALVTFLAGIGVAVRGGFTYPLELFLLLMLGVLLVVALISPEQDAASAFLYVLFFIAAIANVAYLYSVAGYLSAARLVALAVSIGGLVLSGSNMLMQPVPVAGRVTSEVRKLLAAEKKLSDAKKRLETVNFGKVAPASGKGGRRKRGRKK